MTRSSSPSLRARVLGISTGVGDVAHPSPQVLDILAEHAGDVCWAHTDRNGAFSITLHEPGTPVVRLARGKLSDPGPNTAGPPPLLPARPSSVAQFPPARPLAGLLVRRSEAPLRLRSRPSRVRPSASRCAPCPPHDDSRHDSYRRPASRGGARRPVGSADRSAFRSKREEPQPPRSADRGRATASSAFVRNFAGCVAPEYRPRGSRSCPQGALRSVLPRL